MTVLTSTLTGVGLVVLTHSIYSSYEHALLSPPSPTSSSSAAPIAITNPLTPFPTATTTLSPLPLDIILETLLSTLLLTLSIILSSPALRPIRWSEWAGRIEREGWDPAAIEGGDEGKAKAGRESEIVKGGRAGVYAFLQERRGFWDVRGAHSAFADFIRGGEGATGGATVTLQAPAKLVA